MAAFYCGFPPEICKIIRDSLEIDWRTFGRKRRYLHGHTGAVYSTAWSFDGTKLATASEDRTVRVWDVTNRFKCISVLEHNQSVNSVSWSPDSRFLATGSNDKRVYLWRTSDFSIIHSMSDHARVVRSVCWSPDGAFLAAGGKEEAIVLWDSKTGTHVRSEHIDLGGSGLDSSSFPVVRVIEASSSSLWSIAWSLSGKELASGSWVDDAVKIWDARTGRHVKSLRGHRSFVCSVAWSHKGDRIASGSCDAVRLWKLTRKRKQNKQSEITGGDVVGCVEETGVIWAICWSEDDSCLACGSSDNTIRILDSKHIDNYDTNANMKTLRRLEAHHGVVRSVTFSPRSAAKRYLASGGDDSLVVIWE